MATSYTPQGSRRDIQVLSPTQVQDVQIVAALAQPSGVYFEIPIELTTWQSGNYKPLITATANGISTLLALQHVTSAYWTQDLDANGLVRDYMVATVSVPGPTPTSSPFTTQVYIPLGLLGSDPAIYTATVVPMIETAVKQLEDTAGTATTAAPAAPAAPQQTSR